MISRFRRLFWPRWSPQRWWDRDLEKPLAHWLIVAAEAHRDRPAVRCGDRDLTYGELLGKAENLAKELTRVPVAGPVGVCCGQNEKAVIAIVGTLLAGRATVFFSPDDPPARRRRILQVSGVRLVVVETASIWPENSDSGMLLVDLSTLSDATPFDDPLPTPDANADLAWVFTSGQTGQPSGVRHAQRSQLHTVRHLARRCGISPDDRIAWSASLSFGAAWNDLFLALLSGACLCPISPARSDRDRLTGWLDRESISYCHCVPSIFRSIAREERADLARLTSLRWFRLGGEPFRHSDFRLLRDRFPASVNVLLSYGITESGGVIADQVVTAQTEIPGETSLDLVFSMGRPIPGKEVIIDKSGEIIVISRYLSSGYVQDDAKTADRFESISIPSEVRLFRTRDRGRIDVSGHLWHLGRLDGQFKWRGVRFDPAEIEIPLSSHPSVKDAAIVVVEGDSPLLAVCIVTKAGQPAPTLSEVRSQLAAHVAPRLFPNQVINLDCIPRQQNGKIDVDRLRELVQAARDTVPYVPPRSELEDIVAGIWRRLLDRTDLSIYDDFFASGGDSLAAVNFQSDLSQRLGVEIPVAALLGDHPTVAHIVEQIQHSYHLWVRASAPVDGLEVAFPALVPIRKGGERPPIVFLPGGYGSEAELMLFVRLVPYLDPAHAVFGFRATTLYQMDPPPRNVGEIADRYLAELERAIPGAEPILVGNCVAGLVAFEMACRHDRPSRLILIESASRFGWRRKGRPDPVAHPPFAQFYYDLLREFRPGVYSGDAHLMIGESFHDPADPTLGWNLHITGKIAITPLSGNHHDSVREHRDALGRSLAGIIGDGRLH